MFLSWSGERSRRVADFLSTWLNCVIQNLEPWYSPNMDRGTVWFSEILTALSDTTAGVLCLTKENLSKPWILFEAGALAKGVSSARVCTFLIDCTPGDIPNPLAQFNHTRPTKAGLYRLLETLNKLFPGGGLSPQVLNSSFEHFWPDFECRFAEILSETVDDTPPRSDHEMLADILESIRRLEHTQKREGLFLEDDMLSANDFSGADEIFYNA